MSYGMKILFKSGIFGFLLYFRYASGVAAMGLCFTIYFERALATSKYRIYENFKSDFLVTFFVMNAIIWAYIAVALLCMGKIFDIQSSLDKLAPPKIKITQCIFSQNLNSFVY